MQNFERRLMGGHPNSIGNTVEIVAEVLAQPTYFDELFHCYFSEDEVVRLRTSNTMKRLAKENHALLLPYLDRLLTDVAKIDQASTQWTLAQLFLLYQKELTPTQKAQATAIMQSNLAHHQDWIVLNQTLETLARWSQKDDELKTWLLPHLTRLAADERKSITRRAGKWLEKLR
ncbi:MAG: hypothetical protein AAGJ82_15440 [Bacteroidota bacterium]